MINKILIALLLVVGLSSCVNKGNKAQNVIAEKKQCFQAIGELENLSHKKNNADILLENKDFDKVRQYCEPLAKMGDPEIQYKFGYQLSINYGLITNQKITDEGLKWLHKASEQGYADASFRLASIYEEIIHFNLSAELYNEHKLKDYKENPAKYYITAAKQGNQMAQEEVAALYRDGNGGIYETRLPIDFHKSLYWYLKLNKERGGYDFEIAKVFYLLKDYKKALNWYLKSVYLRKKQYRLLEDFGYYIGPVSPGFDEKDKNYIRKVNKSKQEVKRIMENTCRKYYQLSCQQLINVMMKLETIDDN